MAARRRGPLGAPVAPRKRLEFALRDLPGFVDVVLEPNEACPFGLAPTLFDAPSRRSPPDMDWIAHSFLSFVGAQCEARALLGFSWGFAVRDGAIA